MQVHTVCRYLHMRHQGEYQNSGFVYHVINVPLIIVKAGLPFFGYRVMHFSLDSESGPLQMLELTR